MGFPGVEGPAKWTFEVPEEDQYSRCVLLPALKKLSVSEWQIIEKEIFQQYTLEGIAQHNRSFTEIIRRLNLVEMEEVVGWVDHLISAREASYA